MKKFRTIVAFLQAILTFIGCCLIGLVIFSQLKSPYNWIGAFVIIATGFYLSTLVYNMMVRRGILGVMSGDNASSDVDELEPVPGSDFKKLNPEELQNQFAGNQLLFKNGTVSIWGDWEERQLNKRHELSSVEFNTQDNMLSLGFIDNCLLKIKEPRLIFCASTYLKIAKAKEVLWQVPSNPDSFDQYNYLHTGNTIKTKSNTNWHPHSFDIGVGMNAIYLQG